MKKTDTGYKKEPGLMIRLIVLTIVLIIAIPSCRKEDDGANDNIYLISEELKLSVTREFATNLITGASIIYPELGDLKTFIRNGVKVYRVVYNTTLHGRKIKASGLICVPSDPGDYPVVCFQNGTNTLNADAPGNNPANELYMMVECIASMGYIVVIPDYPGFGASDKEVHPYLIAEPTVTAVTDMLFALNEFVDSGNGGTGLVNKYFLIGYSQGGWATLVLHKAVEQHFAGKFNLQASVCGAGPYDLSFLVEDILNTVNYPMPVYLGYIINSYSFYGEFSNPVTDIFNEPYASKLKWLYDGTRTSGQINGELSTDIASLVTSGFLTGHASVARYSSVRESLSGNSITAWKTEIPLLFIHGGSDTSVNPGVTDKMYNEMIAAGSETGICKKQIIQGAGHEEGVIPFAVEAILFIKSLSKN